MGVVVDCDDHSKQEVNCLMKYFNFIIFHSQAKLYQESGSFRENFEEFHCTLLVIKVENVFPTWLYMV